MVKDHLVIDGHADILYRMGKEKLDFYDVNSPLHLGYRQMLKAGIDLQVFVTFVDPARRGSEQLVAVLDSIHRFHQQIERPGGIKPIYDRTGLHEIYDETANPHALLSLEGAECLDGRLSVLYALFTLGIRMIGLTWNHANSVADGVGEPRGAGLTDFGKEVVQHMQSLGMVVDVSHLSEQGVYDVARLATAPIIASHSNARHVFEHRRNLTDEQMKMIVDTGGVIGVTFVPEFITSHETVTMDDLIPHVEHMLDVVGVHGVALGSDFDGIDQTMQDLRRGSDYPRFLERLEKEFGSEVVRLIAYENMFRVLDNTLPTHHSA